MRWLVLIISFFICTNAFADETCPVDIVAVQAAPALANGEYPVKGTWKNVTLPDVGWNHFTEEHVVDEQVAYNGIWYRIDWQRDCTHGQTPPVALVTESIVLAGEIYLNDELLWRDASLVEPMSRSWNMPRMLRLSEPQLRDGINSIRIHVVSMPGQQLGLGRVFVGTTSAMQQIYDELWWRNRTIFTINLIVSAVLGLFFLTLWVAHRNETAYGWYALSTLCWIVFAANILATSPWPFASSAMAVSVCLIALLLSISCFCIFSWRLSGWKLPRIERALWLLTALLVLVMVITPFAYAITTHAIVVSISTFVFAANCTAMPVRAWRTRNPEHVLLGLCLLALLVFSVHDYLVISRLIASSTTIMPYANIAITLCLAGIMGVRHARNARRVERFNVDLQEAVTNAQTELAATLKQQYGLALINSRLQDRLQLAHDLHDSLGGSLLHIMATVEQSPQALQRDRVLSMLKLLRDDLRQTIDSSSSEGVETPVTPKEWIAPLRHRFTTLFDHYNIQSDWLLPDEWVTRPNAMQCLVLTRLVEEGLTNVVRHSHAENVFIRLILNDKTNLTLEIEDDGVGFDVEAVLQSGLSVGIRSMTTRIARLEGNLTITSEPGKTLLKARIKFAGDDLQH